MEKRHYSEVADDQNPMHNNHIVHYEFQHQLQVLKFFNFFCTLLNNLMIFQFTIITNFRYNHF